MTAQISRLCGAVALCGFALIAAHASAQPAPAPAPARPLAEVMRVEAGATCLDIERLTLRVARWREHDTVDARIQVEVRGDASSPTRVAFTVTKQGGPSAERTLADAPADCDQFHSAVALAVALAIDATLMDPRAQKEAELPVPDAAPPPEPKPKLLLSEPREAASPAKPVVHAPNAPMHLDLGAQVGLAIDVLRATTFSFAPRLWLTPWPSIAFAATGFAAHASEQRVGSAPGTVSSTLVVGGLDACAGGEPAQRLDLFVCAGGRVGPLRHVGKGFSPNFTKTTLWAAASFSLQTRLWLGRDVALGAAVEGLLPLAQYVVLVDGQRGQPDQTAAFPGLGFDLLFGPFFRLF